MHFDLRGRSVTRIQSDVSVYLSVDGGYGIRLESVFVVVSNGVTTGIEPLAETAEATRARLQPLTATLIESATATESGTLLLSFSGGNTIEAAADPAYESWSVRGPDGLIAVCMPGGELALWGSSDEP